MNKELINAIEKGCRVIFFKQEDNPNTPHEGPYHIMIMAPDSQKHLTLSGPTMEETIEGLEKNYTIENIISFNNE